MPRTASRKKPSRVNGIAPKTAHRAKVVLNLGGSLPAIESSDNVTAITEVDSKVLVVHFDIPFADELYRCDVIPSDRAKWTITARKKEGVGIELSRPWPSKIKIVCEEI